MYFKYFIFGYWYIHTELMIFLENGEVIVGKTLKDAPE
jgi:hypothetical protein